MNEKTGTGVNSEKEKVKESQSQSRSVAPSLDIHFGCRAGGVTHAAPVLVLVKLFASKDTIFCFA